MWKLFQALVMLAAGWGVVYLVQNEGFPNNGYLTGLIMVGAAWFATWLLSRCGDLLRLLLRKNTPTGERPGDQRSLPRW